MTPLLATLLISSEYLIAVIYTGIYLFISYYLYVRYIKGSGPRYPLASPDPEKDIYFPRTNIPRPIYRDFREHPAYFEKKEENDSKA